MAADYCGIPGDLGDSVTSGRVPSCRCIGQYRLGCSGADGANQRNFPMHRLNLGLLYASAVLATMRVEVAGIRFDYSPILIVHQIALTRLFVHDSKGWIYHASIATGLAIGASLCSWSWFGVAPTAAVFTLLFGHPLAALLIAAVRREDHVFSTPLTRLAAKPLRLYVLHLGLFAAIASLLH